MTDPISTPDNLNQFQKTEVTTTPPAFNKGANLAYWGNMPALYSENATSWPEWMHFIEGWAQDVFLQLVTGLSDTQDNLNTTVNSVNKTLNNWRDEINIILNDWQKIIDSIPDKIRQDVIDLSTPVIQEQIDLYVQSVLPNNVSTLFQKEISTYFNSITSVPETFPTLSDLQAKYPTGKNGIFITADNGHKYYYYNGVWTDAGVYQAVGIADASVEAKKLTGSAQNNGISEGVYFPLVKSNIVNNMLDNPTPLAEHLEYPLKITVSGAEMDKVYLLTKIKHDVANNSFGVLFGYAPKINDNSFDINQVVQLNTTFTSNMPIVDQYGHINSTYKFDDLVFEITYRVPKTGQSTLITFIDVANKKAFDASIIDTTNYVYQQNARGMMKNYGINYPLTKFNPSGNTNTNPSALAEHKKTLRDIKVINPEENTSYLIASIYNNANTKQFGVQFAKATRIDGVSFNISDVTIFNPLSSLSQNPLPVDSDGNTTYIAKYGNTIISATYNVSDMLTYSTSRLLYIDGTSYYDISLINEATFIKFPNVGNNTTGLSYKKPTWLGDSITEINSKATIHYHEIIASDWGSTTSTNMGISGSTIGSMSNPMSVRYTQIPADTDFISVFGGINDYGKNQPLGQYGDTTNSTFYGALYVLLNGLQTQFPTVPKIFISPMHIGSEFGGSFTSTVNGLGLSQDVYEQAIVEMTRKFGVPHLSLFSNMGVTFAVKAQSDYYSADSLHPNNAGQTLIAEKILQFLN